MHGFSNHKFSAKLFVGKKFIQFGKPDSLIFLIALEQLPARLQISKHEVLMVHNTRTTAILSGNKFGLDTALVLTGNTLIKNAENRITCTDIVPTYMFRVSGAVG